MSKTIRLKETLIIATSLLAVYLLVYITGGIKYVYSHTMYIPILLAALFLVEMVGL